MRFSGIWQKNRLSILPFLRNSLSWPKRFCQDQIFSGFGLKNFAKNCFSGIWPEKFYQNLYFCIPGLKAAGETKPAVGLGGRGSLCFL